MKEGKLYKRKCPDCNCDVFYSTISMLNFKIKHNKPCRDCSYKRKVVTKEPFYIRNCPKCEVAIIHKNRAYYSSSIRKNRQCKVCSGKSQIGKFVSIETRQKQSDNHRDVSGENNPNYGKVSALKGRKIKDFRSEESVRLHMERLSEGMFKDHRHTEEDKKRRSESSKGSKNNFYGKTHTQEVRDKASIGTLNYLKTKKETSIEKVLESYLQELNLHYRKQEIFAFWSFDFYLPDQDIYIECDGDYWHVNPNSKTNIPKTASQKKNIGNDKRKNKFMKVNGKKLLRFWETDIMKNKEVVLSKIKEFI